MYCLDIADVIFNYLNFTVWFVYTKMYFPNQMLLLCGLELPLTVISYQTQSSDLAYQEALA